MRVTYLLHIVKEFNALIQTATKFQSTIIMWHKSERLVVEHQRFIVQTNMIQHLMIDQVCIHYFNSMLDLGGCLTTICLYLEISSLMSEDK
jgi:hypothetical protein